MDNPLWLGQNSALESQRALSVERYVSQSLHKLLAVMAQLRNPDGGCPWDLKQNFKTIAPYALEEAYEVVEAIENGDMGGLREELGDLLLQVVFHAQMAKEQGLFDFDAVAEGVATKMVERHPHVFGDKNLNSAEDVLRHWESAKAAKRAAAKPTASVLDGVNTALPAPARAVTLQQRAARVGFDWPGIEGVFAKIREEIDELQAEMTSSTTQDSQEAHDRREDELGDLFFALVNLARHLKIDPETALRRTNRKFEQRFRSVEKTLADQGIPMADATLEAKERLWQAAKKESAPPS